MRTGNTIVFAQVALGLVPEVLDPVDMVFLVGEQKGMLDPVVIEPGHIQRIVAIPAAGTDNAVGNDFSSIIGISIADAALSMTLRANLAAPLQKTEDSDFSLGAASAPSFSLSAEITLVQFDSAIEGFVGFLKGDDFAKLLEVVGRLHFVDAGRTGGTSRGRYVNEILDEFCLLASTQSALSISCTL